MENLLRARFLELLDDTPGNTSNVDDANGHGAEKKKDGEEETSAQKASDSFELLLQERWRERTLNGGVINVLGCGAPELLVLAAEAALHCGNPQVASNAVDEFFLQDIPKNQFYCRAMFAKAMVQCHRIRADTECHGQDLIARVVAASKLVMQGICGICAEPATPAAGKTTNAATPPPAIPTKYSFLAYNGSVHLWAILRPLQRSGTKKHTIEPMQFFVTALQQVNEPNIAWLMRLQMSLASAYCEVNDQANAQRVLKDAMTAYKTNDALLTQAGTTDKRKAGEHGPGGVRIPRHQFKELNHELVQAAGSNRAEALKIAKSYLHDHGDVSLMIQCIRIGAIDSPAEITKTITELAGKVLSEVNSAVGAEGDGVETSSKPDSVRRLAELGRIALDHGIQDITNRCRAAIASFKGTKSPQSLIAQHLFHARSLVDEETCRAKFEEVNVASNAGTANGASGSAHVSQLQQEMALFITAQRVEAMRVLESAILTAKRYHEFGTLEEGCVMVWNFGLPLLQPHLRKNVLRAFLCAVNALEEIESNRKMLRAQLHTEVAKCEIEADFVAKATIHVSKALALDYAVPVQDDVNADAATIAQLESKARTLDVELEPLRRRLQLRSKIYDEPDRPEDKAILCVEQAKEAREYYVRHSLLVRAAKWLDVCADANIYALNAGRLGEPTNLGTPQIADDQTTRPESTSSTTKPVRQCAPGLNISVNEFVQLWSTIAKLAWQGKMLNVAQKAAEKVIAARSGKDGQSILPASMLAADTGKAGKTSGSRETKDESVEGGAVDEGLDQSILILKAQAHFLMAEVMMELLRQAEEEDAPQVGGLSVRALGIVVPQLMIDKVQEWEQDAAATGLADDSASEAEDAEEYYYFDLEIPDLKERLLSHLVAAMRIGARTKEDWLVENTCCYLWNYHMHVFATRERAMLAMPSLLSVMAEAEETLDSLTTHNLALHSRLCYCLAFALNEQGQLAQAAQIARRGSTLGDARHNGQLVGILHRAQRKGGTPEPLPDDPLLLVFAVLELVKLDPELMPQAEKLELLMKARESLASVTNGAPATPQTPGGKGKGAGGQGKSGVTKSDTPLDTALLEELWTKVALELLDAQEQHAAIGCAAQATRLAPRDDAPTSALLRVPPKRARWYSVAETVYGLALSQTIRSSKQEITLQDQIREDAFDHLCHATAWGVRAALPKLVVDSAMHYCNIASPFLVSPITRRALVAPTKKLLKLIESAAGDRQRDQTEIDLHLKLYEILFRCLIDGKKWAEGLDTVKAAFRFIPQSSHGQLWKSRVIFSSKLGLDVVAGLSKMSSGNTQMQARAHATLARAAAHPKDQLQAYSVVLDTCTNPTDRAKYLIEVAEWMHTQHFDSNDVINTLMLAADVLIDVEDPGDDEFDEDEDGDGDIDGGKSVARSRMTSRSKHSKQSGRSGRSGKSKKSSRSKRSRTGGKSVASRKTHRSKGGRSKAATKRTGATSSKRSGKTKAGAEGVDGEEEEDDGFVEFNVSHALDMIQIFTMLARVSKPRSWDVAHKDSQEMVAATTNSCSDVMTKGAHSRDSTGMALTVEVKSPGGQTRHSPRTQAKEPLNANAEPPLGSLTDSVGADRGHYLALAVHYIHRLWELCVVSANAALATAEKHRMDANNAQGGGNAESKSLDDKSDMRKGTGAAVLHVPTSLDEWVAFEAQKVLDAAAVGEPRAGHELMNLTVKSMGRPGQRLHYLSELVEMLKSESMHCLCVPALTTAQVIAHSGLPEAEWPVTKVVLDVEMALLLEKLGYSGEGSGILTSLDLSHVGEPHFATFRDQVLQMERIQDRSVQHPYLDIGFLASLFGYVPFTQSTAAAGADANDPTNTTLNKAGDESASQVSRPSATKLDQGSLAFNGELHVVRRHCASETQIRHHWVREADRLCKIGETVAAKLLLREACRHNVALEDLGNHAKALQVLARIFVLEGDVEPALCAAVTSWRCMQAAGAGIHEWRDGALILTMCLERNARWREAIELLDALRSCVERIIERRHDVGSFPCHVEEYAIAGELLAVSAQVYHRQAVAVAPFEKADSSAHQAESIDRFIQSCSMLSGQGLGWRMTTTALQCGSVVLYGLEAGVEPGTPRLSTVKQWLKLALRVAQDAFSSQEHGSSGNNIAHTLAQIQLVLGRFELGEAYTRHCTREAARVDLLLAQPADQVGGSDRDPVSARSAASGNNASPEQLSVARRWLIQTAPLPEPSEEEMQVPLSSRAVALFSGAHFVSQSLSPAMRARAKCLLASALGAAVYVGEADVDAVCGDDVWDEKSVMALRAERSNKVAAAEAARVRQAEREAERAAAADEAEQAASGSAGKGGKGGKAGKKGKESDSADGVQLLTDEELKEKQLEAYEADLELGPVRAQAASTLRSALESARTDHHGRVPAEELALTAQGLVQCLGLTNPRETLTQLCYMQHLKAMKWMQGVYFDATVGCALPSNSTMFWEHRMQLLENLTDLNAAPRGCAIEAYMSGINTPLRLLNTGTVHAPESPDVHSPAACLDGLLSNQDTDVITLVLSASSAQDYVYAGLVGNQSTDKVSLGRAFLGKRGRAHLEGLRNKMATYSKILTRFMVHYGNARAEAAAAAASEQSSVGKKGKSPTKSVSSDPDPQSEGKEGVAGEDGALVEPHRILVDCESEETLASVNEGVLDPEVLLVSIAVELWELILAPLLASSQGLADALRTACDRGAKLFFVADACIARLPINVAFAEHGFAFSGVSMDFSVPFAYSRLERAQLSQSATAKYLYVVDPRAESDEASAVRVEASDTDPEGDGSENARGRSMGQYMESLASEVGGAFTGVAGKPDGYIGTREWQDLVTQLSKTKGTGDGDNGGSGPGVLIYHGCGTLLNFARPTDLADIDLSNCRLAVLADRCTNERFHRRFAKSRTTQTRSRAALEEPLESAALMSLTGVHAVVMNQWSATRPANESLIRRALKLSGDSGTGGKKASPSKGTGGGKFAIDILGLSDTTEGVPAKSREVRNAILVGHPSMVLP